MTCGFWMPVLIFGEIPVRMWHLSSVAVIHPPRSLGGNASSLHHGARPFHIMVYPGASVPLSKIQKLNSCLGWQKEEADGTLKNYIKVFRIQRKSHYQWSPSLSRKRKLDSVSLFQEGSQKQIYTCTQKTKQSDHIHYLRHLTWRVTHSFYSSFCCGNQLCMGVTWQHLALLYMWLLGICWNLLSHSDTSVHLGVKKSLDKYCPLSCLGGTIPTCMLPGSSEGSEQDWGPFAHSSDQKTSPSFSIKFFTDSHSWTLGWLH